MNTLQPDWTTV